MVDLGLYLVRVPLYLAWRALYVSVSEADPRTTGGLGTRLYLSRDGLGGNMSGLKAELKEDYGDASSCHGKKKSMVTQEYPGTRKDRADLP